VSDFAGCNLGRCSYVSEEGGQVTGSTEDSFDTFYRTSRDRLVGRIAALTGDPAEAHDHVQEAFVRAWTRWERVGAMDDPEAWVRRVAYHLAVSRWRRARRLVFGTRTEEEIAWDPQQLTVLDALRALPQKEREAVVLHHLMGLPVDQIAAELGAPSGTVKSWLSRGRAHLAAALTEEVRHD
jgi:RNA polymerase sigma-70 factor (ECF subfamily)